jgi:hypothetical protein
MTELTEKMYNDAVRSAAYEVRRLVNVEQMDEGDAIHQEVDGSEWVFKYYHARHTLMYSSNEDAFFDEGMSLSDLNAESAGALNCALAYYAMRADVLAKLDEIPEQDEEIEDECVVEENTVDN